MPHPCPHHCPPEHGGLVVALAVVIAAAVMIKVLLAILTVLLIILAVIAGLALLGGAVYVIATVRSGRLSVPAVLPSRPAAPISTPQRRELPADEHHLHLHGVDDEQLARVIRQSITEEDARRQ